MGGTGKAVMDTYVDERDYKLLEADKYNFFVLKRIIGGECNLLLTDHERMIVCFTGHPFPVWIWTADDASEEEMERAYQLTKEKKLLTGEYHFNIKYSLAEYFIRRAAEDGSELKITTNMFAYDCLDPVRPKTGADGEIYCCEMKDLEEVVEFLAVFHDESEGSRICTDALYRC